MVYLVLCRYRNLLGKWTNEVHPCVFDTQAEAELAVPAYAEKKRAMVWIVTSDLPPPPPFKLVDDTPADDSDVEYIDGGKIFAGPIGGGMDGAN